MTPELDRSDLDRFRAVVARRLGLDFGEGRLESLATVLRQRMAAAGSRHLDGYLERLASRSEGAEELRAVAELLTVNETFFFRNPDHFRAFAQFVLPERIRAKAHERRLRILSAGCASGEEPYSLAIVVRESLPDLDDWDVEIVGVDLNPSMIARAARARYSEWSLRATPEDVRGRYFRADGRDHLLDDRVRRLVRFEEGNLVDDDLRLWQPGLYDVVFCRNVIMYLTPEVTREVVRRMQRSLLAGGFLFLGHAETLRGLSQDFHLCHTHGTFYYQKRVGSPPSRPAVSTGAPTDPDTGMLPGAAGPCASWIDAIQQASRRIAELAGGRSDQRGAPSTKRSRPAPARCPDLGLVFEAMRQERFSDALARLSALPADLQEGPDALLVRAALLVNDCELSKAEDICSRLLALDELNAGAHYVMALCREHAGDVTGAVEHEQIAIYLDPGFAMPHLHLGLLARRRGDEATASRELSQALILLAGEDASRLLLFGGGFSRDTLLAICRSQLRAAGAER